MRDAAALLSPIALKPDDAGVVLTQRRLAAEALVKAFDAWPASVQPLDAAARQLELASSTREGPQPVGLLQEGLDIASLAVREHGKPSSMVAAIELSARLGQITGDGEYWNTAITLAQQVAAGDPHGIGAWRRLGDVLWLADRRPEAADAYRHALESDLQFALDPLKQLSDQDRQTIRDRIEAK